MKDGVAQKMERELYQRKCVDIKPRVLNEACSDEELVLSFQNSPTPHIMTVMMKRYKHRLRSICRAYFLQGGEFEDLLQEAYLGLFKAIRDYRPNKGAFLGFAILCVRRQVITAVKQASRCKHIPLNQAISLEKPLDNQGIGGKVLGDVIPSPSCGHPEDTYIYAEFIEELRQSFLEQFSVLESKLLSLRSEGHSYAEMGLILGVSERSVTNGMYRVQKKLHRLRKTFCLLQTFDNNAHSISKIK